MTCDLKLWCSLVTHSCSSSSHLPVYTMLVIRRSSDCGDFGCVFSPQVFPGLWLVKFTRSVTIESWQTCVVKRQFRSHHPKFIYTFDDRKSMIRVSFHKNKICYAKFSPVCFLLSSYHSRSPPCRTSALQSFSRLSPISACHPFQLPLISTEVSRFFWIDRFELLCQSMSRLLFSY